MLRERGGERKRGRQRQGRKREAERENVRKGGRERLIPALV